jgi:hypothetical protein
VIFWAVLLERAVQDRAVNALLDVAAYNGSRGYTRIELPYMRTDMARNQLCWTFLEQSREPNDVLVMLDNDHTHPHFIVERLASHPSGRGVVGALGYRREAPFNPMFYWRQNGGYIGPQDFELGKTFECDAIATCAIAIRRWVLEQTKQEGTDCPWFRYSYREAEQVHDVSEDMYFAWLCEQAGIHHYCDTSIVTPHLRGDEVGPERWQEFLRQQKEQA